MIGYLLTVLQVALALAWQPVEWTARLAIFVGNALRFAGDVGFRPVYYGVVRTKRRRRGEPLWKPADLRIGIWPPCESCGENVPPGRHLERCDFLKPRTQDGEGPDARS